jgi:hypothetical protein
MQRVWGLLVVALGCAPLGSRDAGSERPVTGDGAYLTHADIPRRWQHIFAMDVAGPFYLAFSDKYACRIDAETYTMLRRGQMLRCVWRAPHGT